MSRRLHSGHSGDGQLDLNGICPRAAGDVFFLGADGIGVDGGRGKLGVTEPFLHQVEGDAGGVGSNAKAMP